MPLLPCMFLLAQILRRVRAGQTAARRRKGQRRTGEIILIVVYAIAHRTDGIQPVNHFTVRVQRADFP